MTTALLVLEFPDGMNLDGEPALPSDNPERIETRDDAGPALPGQGRLLGLDYGTKRVGVAISTPDQSIASPLEVYTRRDRSRDSAYFAALAEEHRVVGIVVGLPRHIAGNEGVKAAEAREFAAWMMSVMRRPVDFADERYTSAVATDLMREAGLPRSRWKATIDKLAAQIFLQAYLDARQPADDGRTDDKGRKE